MKIERSEMKNTIKILKEIEYMPLASKTKLVFPLDTEGTKEIDGISLNFANNNFGSEKMPEPVLELREDEENGVFLSYCDLTYARKFDVITYCELIGKRPSKKAIEKLNNLECYLVDKQNILISFEI